MATVDGEQTRPTSVIKKTLNPYWNEQFDLYVSACVCVIMRIPPLTVWSSPCSVRSTKRASSLSRFSIRRNSKRRTRASWVSSMSGSEMSSIYRWVVMVRLLALSPLQNVFFREADIYFLTLRRQKCSQEISRSQTTI